MTTEQGQLDVGVLGNWKLGLNFTAVQAGGLGRKLDTIKINAGMPCLVMSLK